MDGNRTRVQHLEGGIVAAIHVDDGGRVDAGDALISLEDVRTRAQKVAIRSEYFDTMGRVARLRAERDGLEEIAFPDHLIEASANPQVAEVVRMQEQLFRSRRHAFEGQQAILASRIPQYHSMIKGLDAQLKALESQQEIFEEELEVAEELFAKGIERRPRVLQLRRNVASTQGEIGDLVEKRGQTQLAISEVEMRLIDMLDSRFAAIDEELTGLLSKLIDLEDRLRAAEDQLERTIIRAPVSGVVVGLGVHNTGATIQPGEILLSIVPNTSSIVVHARISPMDVDLVSPGLDAKVVLSSFKQSDVPPIDAWVRRISADRLEDDRSGESYFEAVLEFVMLENQLGGDFESDLMPGMPAEVFVRTGTRSPIDYLLQPMRDSFRRAMRES